MFIYQLINFNHSEAGLAVPLCKLLAPPSDTPTSSPAGHVGHEAHQVPSVESPGALGAGNALHNGEGPSQGAGLPGEDIVHVLDHDVVAGFLGQHLALHHHVLGDDVNGDGHRLSDQGGPAPCQEALQLRAAPV